MLVTTYKVVLVQCEGLLIYPFARIEIENFEDILMHVFNVDVYASIMTLKYFIIKFCFQCEVQ